MDSEKNVPFYKKHPNFFENNTFKFEGFFNPSTKKAYENLVECLGGTVSDNSPYVFCDQYHASKQHEPSLFINYKYIKHSLQAHKPLDLEYFRFPAKDSPSDCTKSLPSTQFYEDNLKCKVCTKKRKSDDSNSSEGKKAVYVAKHKGRGATISSEEQKFIINYLIKNELIHKAKSRAKDSPWHHMHANGHLTHRSIETLSNNMRKKILPNIEFYGLQKEILQKFLRLRK